MGDTAAAVNDTADTTRLMKAVAVTPGRADSVHLRTLPVPRIRDPREVLVEVVSVGVDGTDREIIHAEYGEAPAGDDFLVIGHESLGRVLQVGDDVRELRPGDLVAATVRRPGDSPYDRIGLSDMTTDEEYFERGISRLHGFLCESYVEAEQYLVKVPRACAEVGVLMEPASIVVKGIEQAFEIQRRMKIWSPARAAVTGAGTIGLLAALLLRLRGLDVTVFGLTEPPYLNSELLDGIGARYYSTRQVPVDEASDRHGPFDLIFEATGYSPMVFECMEVLARNGVLILSSVTGGERTAEVPADRLNLEFVLGNKLLFGTVNANRGHFEQAARELAMGVSEYPGFLPGMLTHPVQGLENFRELVKKLLHAEDAIKVFLTCKAAS